MDLQFILTRLHWNVASTQTTSSKLHMSQQQGFAGNCQTKGYQVARAQTQHQHRENPLEHEIHDMDGRTIGS